MLGIGNYDVNVLMKALEQKNKLVNWYDKRREITKESIELNEAYGYILNIPSDFSFGFITLPIKSRHWIALRKINDENYYNLDSKQNQPLLIGNAENFITYLRNEMKSNDIELFIIKNN